MQRVANQSHMHTHTARRQITQYLCVRSSGLLLLSHEYFMGGQISSESAIPSGPSAISNSALALYFERLIAKSNLRPCKTFTFMHRTDWDFGVPKLGQCTQKLAAGEMKSSRERDDKFLLVPSKSNKSFGPVISTPAHMSEKSALLYIFYYIFTLWCVLGLSGKQFDICKVGNTFHNFCVFSF